MPIHISFHGYIIIFSIPSECWSHSEQVMEHQCINRLMLAITDQYPSYDHLMSDTEN